MINVAEQEIGFGSDTTEGCIAEALDIADVATSGDAGAMHAMRAVDILHLQRVEDILCLCIGRTGEFHGFATVEGEGDLLATKLAVAYLIEALDAQVAVLVLKHGVGHIEASVDDTYHDALTCIGLRQFGARAVDDLVGLSDLTGGVGLLRNLRGHADDGNTLYIGK